MRSGNFLFAALCLLLCVGCSSFATWPTWGHDAGRRYSAEHLRLATGLTPVLAGARLLPGQSAVYNVVADEKRVYLQGSDGIHAYDLHTGQPLWSFPGAYEWGGILLTDDSIVAVSGEQADKIDCVSGKSLAHLSLTGRAVDSVAVGDMVYILAIRQDASCLTAISAKDFGKVWSRDAGAGQTGMLAADRTHILAIRDRQVTDREGAERILDCFRHDGVPLWNAAIGLSGGWALLDDGHCVNAGFSGSSFVIQSMSIERGTKEWSRTVGLAGSACASDGKLLCRTGAGLLSLDIATGTPVWESESSPGKSFTGVDFNLVATQDAVLYITQPGRMAGVSIATGRPLWDCEVGGLRGTDGHILVAGNVVCLVSNGRMWTWRTGRIK